MSKDLHRTDIIRDPKTGIITDIKVVDAKEITPFDGKKNQNLLSPRTNGIQTGQSALVTRWIDLPFIQLSV